MLTHGIPPEFRGGFLPNVIPLWNLIFPDKDLLPLHSMFNPSVDTPSPGIPVLDLCDHYEYML